MSDNFRMLVDADVSLDEAGSLCRSVIAEFQRLGLIERELDANCVLRGSGYPPCPEILDYYDLQPLEPFFTLRNSGVEALVKRSFNYWALGPSCEGFTCPACDTNIEWFHQEFQKDIMEAAEHWLKASPATNVVCPYCEKQTDVTEWPSQPPLGFGNLAFRLWNWPPFDSSRWLIQIPSIIREITGHTIIESWGHI